MMAERVIEEEGELPDTGKNYEGVMASNWLSEVR